MDRHLNKRAKLLVVDKNTREYEIRPTREQVAANWIDELHKKKDAEKTNSTPRQTAPIKLWWQQQRTPGRQAARHADSAATTHGAIDTAN